MEKCQKHRHECQIRSGFWSEFPPCIGHVTSLSFSLLTFKPGIRIGWGFDEIMCKVHSRAPGKW